jgi:hypothetical protein
MDGKNEENVFLNIQVSPSFGPMTLADFGLIK